ncbi:MAG: hypothetical protein D6698_14905 [Gammaproteobacteria bacterium]|nr:MAG: hypothetical protein D6698_14905 [Gammaproteobacteria bacterium]
MSVSFARSTAHHPSDKVSAGYIDFYKADHFIIEAKQSSEWPVAQVKTYFKNASRQPKAIQDCRDRLTELGVITCHTEDGPPMGHRRPAKNRVALHCDQRSRQQPAATRSSRLIPMKFCNVPSQGYGVKFCADRIKGKF